MAAHHFISITKGVQVFLENKEYEEVMEISGLIPFDNSLDMKVNYIDNDGVKHIPLKVKELLGEKSGIWIDNTNHKIGFAGIDTALILDLEKLDILPFRMFFRQKEQGMQILLFILVPEIICTFYRRYLFLRSVCSAIGTNDEKGG